VNRRVKRITYNRRRDNIIIFSKFRERYLNKYYPESKKAEFLYKKDLKKLSANFSNLFFIQYSLFSEYWFHKNIYNSIILVSEIDKVKEQVLQASLNGTLFYLPNHQAHIDSLVVSWIANLLRVPQPLFCAWSTLAKKRSAYLMPMVNACLLDREIMDDRFQCSDPFRNTRRYQVGYTVLLNEYLNRMFSIGVDTLVYPEGGRSYSGAIGEAKIKGIFKGARKVQDELGHNKIISVIPLSISYSLVPETKQLIRSYYAGTIIPPLSLFHDLTDGDNLYGSFKPDYKTKTDFPFIKAFIEKRIPIFCAIGEPISLLDNKEITLYDCFGVVKRNLKILPQYFIAKLLLADPKDMAERWKDSGINGLIEPARSLRAALHNVNFDEAFFDDDGLADIISIGMEFFKYGGYISTNGDIRNSLVLEYYSNKISI
jgi:1-acyl-sn-glycerol-3-phosphate acyltransferase